jgi:phosphopantetheinyl transferase (holo-ACP synthase)
MRELASAGVSEEVKNAALETLAAEEHQLLLELRRSEAINEERAREQLRLKQEEELALVLQESRHAEIGMAALAAKEATLKAMREKQAALDQAYQDFITQQQHPYKQLGFMSDLVRGSASLASTGAKSVYEAPPSTLSQIGGLGLGALGLYNMYNQGTGQR